MHRLFVAIRPPEAVRDLLLDRWRACPDLRWQDDEQLHLTLRFIGEVERPLAEDLALALGAIRFERFRSALAGVGRFEQRRTRRAVGRRRARRTGRGARRQGRARLPVAPASSPSAAPSTRTSPWRAGKAAAPQRSTAFLERHAGLASEPLEVDEFILYESHLGRDGAHYEAVASYPLS